MAQFDVYRVKKGAYALDCQSHVLAHLASRFTVPLMPPDQVPAGIARLNPQFDIDGKGLVMATHLAGAIPATALTDRVTSLAEHDLTIQAALDMLTGGY